MLILNSTSLLTLSCFFLPCYSLFCFADFLVFNSQAVKSENTQTASQVMGHILTLNNTLPNDLDFDSLQGGLECDVNSVIQHELSVEGNLEFNFDPAAAAAAAANNASVSLAHGASTRSWVH